MAVVAHTYNPSTHRQRQKGQELKSILLRYKASKFEVRLGNMKPLKKNANKTNNPLPKAQGPSRKRGQEGRKRERLWRAWTEMSSLCDRAWALMTSQQIWLTTPHPDKISQHYSKERGRGSWVSTLSCWQMMASETVRFLVLFCFQGKAHGRSTRLEWVAQHPWVYGKHQLALLNLGVEEENKQKKKRASS